MSTLIELGCPNCGHNLAEENLHSNILQCPRCNSYTYYESGMFNKNVFFGLLRCQSYQLDKLRNTIIDKYVQQGSLRAIRELQYLHAERLLIPMREFDFNGKPKAVSLLEESLETADVDTDVRQLLENKDDISSLFSMQNLHPLRLSDVSDEIDNSGYITHTIVLPVGRTKRSIDTAYNLKPDSMIRILYLPIYRISFNDKSPNMLCFANDKLTGFEVRVAKKRTDIDLDFEGYPQIAAVISFLLTIIVDIVMIATGFIGVDGGSNPLMKAFVYIIFLALISIILAIIIFSAVIVVLFFLSKAHVSLNVITSAKKWLIRRILTRKFRLNEKRR